MFESSCLGLSSRFVTLHIANAANKKDPTILMWQQYNTKGLANFYLYFPTDFK